MQPFSCVDGVNAAGHFRMLLLCCLVVGGAVEAEKFSLVVGSSWTSFWSETHEPHGVQRR